MFGFEVRVGDGDVVEGWDVEAEIDVGHRRRAEAERVLRKDLGRVAKLVAQAELGRELRFGQVDCRDVRIVLGVDCVAAAVDLVAFVANPGDQRQGAVAGADLVLPEGAKLGRRGWREVAHRETLADQYIGHAAGREIGLQCIAKFVEIGLRVLDAVHLPVARAKRVEAAFRLQVESLRIGLEQEAAVAQRGRRARRHRGARLQRALFGATALAVQCGTQRIQARRAESPFAAEAEALAVELIVAEHLGGGRVLPRAVHQ